jgi:hypothetical protein
VVDTLKVYQCKYVKIRIGLVSTSTDILDGGKV